MPRAINSRAPPPPPRTQKWYGLTAPISEDLPTVDDLIHDRHLIETLKSYGVFEGALELKHRKHVLKQLESLYKEWLTEMCIEMKLPESVTEKVGGKIVPFGSYHLGVASKGADFDVLCVGPGFLERKDFSHSFADKLKAQKEVKDLRVIENAFVPVVKLSYDGLEIDLVFALLPRKSIPENIDLLKNEWLRTMDVHCVRSLNGYRVTEEILRLVPNIHTFTLALRTIKLWAKQRNIYSNMLGFLGGVSWSILVARISQAYPNASASTLVTKFFKVYDMWEWPIPIMLKGLEDRYFKLPVWDPRVNVSDRYHLMPIITPAYPQQNSAFNVSPSTLAILTEEIQRGHVIAQEIQKKKADWSTLFDKPDFFKKYKYYIQLQATSATAEQHLEWVGLVESKVRLLVATLERNDFITRAHIDVQPFPGSSEDQGNAKEGIEKKWLIGLAINTERYSELNLNRDLTPNLTTFSETVYRQAHSCGLFKEGMTISSRYMSQHNNSVSVTSGSSVQASTSRRPTPVSSMSSWAAKRARSPHSETSIKKFKSEEKRTKDTCSTSASLSKSPSQSVSSPSTKRPRTPERETPSKKLKIDLDPPTAELSDTPTGHTETVGVVKNGIKLRLIGYSTESRLDTSP
ncbi:poly(A) polymerase type 3-like [Cottoperca gobio]|uniref:Poly(A) polymerase n=1 Tax=Cottoperca gobio TaxID=56716 RepID=A0A6J2P8M6_COTGO|nr:poly(A) polymerase type 3-like [Cottoperca gobio]